MENNEKLNQLLNDAWTKRREGQYEEARQLLKEAHQMCDSDNHRALGRIFHIYAQFESDHNNDREALDYSAESVRHYQKSGDKNKLAHATRHYADILRRLDKKSDAELHYRQAIQLYRSDPDTSKADLANALRGFALLLEARRKNTEAIDIWKETKSHYQAIHLTAGVEEAEQRLNALL